ncbi:hypothetical protein [Bacillus massilinigeriensis]|uniref:hypothetical protein n=1 Tax=Bacillus mediterraneensis TaxID=1805474 RepID=UPI0008F83AD3|nr:hypothetical protein [Bacillus mediterraneensis]
MRKYLRNDKQLEELLRQLPVITDRRSPRQIFHQVKASRKRRKPSWLIPACASIGALLLMFILVPSLSKNGFHDQQNNTHHSSLQHADSSHFKAPDEKTGMLAFHDDEELSLDGEHKSYDKETAVYPEDLRQHDTVSFAIPDKNGQVAVPITVLVKKENKKSWFDRFKETMPRLEEEKWGLKDFYPMDAKFEYEKKTGTLRMDVKNSHPYNSDASPEAGLMNIIDETIPKEEVKRVNFTTGGTPGISIGGEQVVNSHEKLQVDRKRAYLFYYPAGTKTPYLVPTGESYVTIGKALKRMGEKGLSSSSPLVPSLPKKMVKGIKEESTEQPRTLHIELVEGAVYDSHFIHYLEAILFTAKEFGYAKIKIDNPETRYVGRFNLDEEIAMPLAPNKQTIK